MKWRGFVSSLGVILKGYLRVFTQVDRDIWVLVDVSVAGLMQPDSQ